MQRVPGLGVLAVAVCLLGNVPAHAESSVEFFGSGSFVDGGKTYQLQSSAVFSYDSVAKVLTIELTNTSTQTGLKSVPESLLTGLFFDVKQSAFTQSTKTDLSLTSATAEKVINKNTGTNKNVKYPGVNGGWRYAHTTNSGGFSGTDVAQHYGLGTAGMDIFGGGGGGTQFDYGIVSDKYTSSNATQTVKDVALVKNTIVFKLSGSLLKSDFDIRRDLGNIRFQYGTSTCEAHYNGHIESAPEPSSMALLGTGLVGMMIAARRRKSAAA